MKKNPKKQGGFAVLELFIFFVLAVVIAGGAYYVGKNHSKATKSDQTTAVTGGQQSATSADVKPGWHLYTDSAAGFSLQLPSGWSYKKGQVSKQADGTIDRDYQGNPIINPDSIMPNSENDQSTNGISEVMADTTTLSAEAYFQANGYGRANYSGHGSSSPVNGYTAFTATVTSPGGDASVPVVVDKGKVVQFFYYTKPSMNKYADLCAQIVSTIKFQ